MQDKKQQNKVPESKRQDESPDEAGEVELRQTGRVGGAGGAMTDDIISQAEGAVPESIGVSHINIEEEVTEQINHAREAKELKPEHVKELIDKGLRGKNRPEVLPEDKREQRQ